MSVQEEKEERLSELLRDHAFMAKAEGKPSDPAVMMKDAYDLGVEYQRGRIPVGTMMRLQRLSLPPEEHTRQRLGDLSRKTEKKWLVDFQEATFRYLSAAFDLGVRDERARVAAYLKPDRFQLASHNWFHRRRP